MDVDTSDLVESSPEEKLEVIDRDTQDEPPRKRRRLRFQIGDDSDEVSNTSRGKKRRRAADPAANERAVLGTRATSNRKQNQQKRTAKRRRTSSLAVAKARMSPSAAVVNTRVMDWSKVPGGIKTIVLVNFLCHENLEVDFHPGTTIISGQNGSGKSAIEAGLSLVLGSTARQTKRGKSFNDVLRFTSDEGLISVQINNTGGERMPEYGDTIIIQRRLRRTRTSGTATWRVLDGDTMEIKSKTRKSVQRIIDHYGFRVNNPCVVLKQDTAKAFLNSSNPKDKFKFFMGASCLSDHAEELDKCRSDVATAEVSVREAEAAQSAIIEMFNQAKRMFDRLIQLEEAEARIALYERAVKWKRFKSTQKALTKAETEYARAQELLQKAETRYAEEKAKLDAPDSSMEGLQDRLTELERDVDRCDADVRLASRKVKVARGGLKKHKKEVESAKKKITSKRSSIRRKHSEIEKLRADTGSAGNSIAEKHAERDGFQTDLENARRELDRLKTNNSQSSGGLEEKIAELEGALKVVDDRIKTLKQDKTAANRQLRDIGKNANSINRFKLSRGRGAPRTEDIVKDITRFKRRFSVMPIGPLGQFVELKDGAQNYVQQVMATLGRTMTSFVCNTMADCEELKRIGRQHNVYLNVIVRKAPTRGRHNVPPNALARDFPNIPRIFDLMEITDDWAFNTIVDMCNPEFMYIHGDLTGAYEFGQRVRRMPRMNSVVRGIYTESELFRVHVGEKTSSSHPINEQQPVLASDTRTQQEYYRSAIQRVEDQLSGLEHERRERSQRLGAARKEKTNLRNAVQRCQRRLSTCEKNLEGVEAEIEDLEESKKDDDHQAEIDNINDEIRDDEDEIVRLREKLSELEERLVTVEEHVAGLQQKEDEAQAVVDEAMRVYDEFNGQMKHRIAERQNAQKMVKKFKEASTIAKTRMVEFEKAIGPLQDNLDQYSIEAKECGEDPTEGRRNEFANKSIPKLESDVRAIREQATREAGTLPPADDIRNRYEEAKEPFDEHMNRVNRANENLRVFQQSLESKFAFYEKLKENTATSVSDIFKSIMHQQGHHGDIDIDFESETLNLHVRMKGHETQETLELRASSQNSNKIAKAKVVNTKTLSGGERSFTQLCLIMALQSFSQSPFCVYDEFDVFMDDVNRAGSIRSLLNMASLNPRQYIYITPHDVTPLFKDESDLKCIKLHPPRDMGPNEAGQ